MDNQIYIYIAVTIAVFLVLRDIACWYWKINYQVKLLEEIRDELKKLNNVNL